MPFASKAQIAKFKQLRKEGKISLAQIAHKSRGTVLSDLPERVNIDNLKNQVPKK